MAAMNIHDTWRSSLRSLPESITGDMRRVGAGHRLRESSRMTGVEAWVELGSCRMGSIGCRPRAGCACTRNGCSTWGLSSFRWRGGGPFRASSQLRRFRHLGQVERDLAEAERASWFVADGSLFSPQRSSLQQRRTFRPFFRTSSGRHSNLKGRTRLAGGRGLDASNGFGTMAGLCARDEETARSLIGRLEKSRTWGGGGLRGASRKSVIVAAPSGDSMTSAIAPLAIAAAAGTTISASPSPSPSRSSSFTSPSPSGPSGNGKGGNGPVEGLDLPYRYDPEAIAAYFMRRPQEVVARALYIAFRGAKLGMNILMDWQQGKNSQMEKVRARELRSLITNLGPTAVKIGQALSIRPDLLPVAYLEELQKLQDRVPPFSSEEARALILEGLGQSAEEIFSELTAEPVAAASLGQVYKGRLRKNGEVIALKVQRPGVLEGISLDLYLLRTFAFGLRLVPSFNSDFVGVLDNWAVRFFDELDYIQEGNNAIRFAEDMKSLQHIVVAKVYMEYTSRKVLTTAWVEGEKLSESNADDVSELVDIMLNCYLVQLLETGFLHADPHPGNLIRTPEGNLCVLDFGLVTEVTEDQRYTLIEYVAHLVNSDYDQVAADLIKLGFIPENGVDPEKAARIAPALARVFGQLVQGGGFVNVNIATLTNDLAKMSEEYVFVIPPYFIMILRAFGVLEGIGLDADPNYAIVNGCYPYISKRLLTDDSPRTRGALQYFLYAGEEHLNIDRLENLTAGFQTFREMMDVPSGWKMIASDGGANVGVSSRRKKQIKSGGLDPVAKDALLLVFSQEGSYIQEMLLMELTRTIDVLSREACAELWRMVTTRLLHLPIPISLSAPFSWPLLLPGVILGAVPMARLTERDQRSLETVRRLWGLLEPQLLQPGSAAGMAEAAQDLVPLLGVLLPGVGITARRFTIMLLQRLTLRLADDLDGQNSIVEWERLTASYHLAPSVRNKEYFKI